MIIPGDTRIVRDIIHLQFLGFLQQSIWGFWSFRMWHCVTSEVLLNQFLHSSQTTHLLRMKVIH